MAYKLGLNADQFHGKLNDEFFDKYFPNCPLYKVSSTKQTLGWYDLRAYLLKPTLRRLSLDKTKTEDVTTLLGTNRQQLNTLCRIIWRVTYPQLSENSKLIVLYEALLKNPKSIQALLQDPRVSKFYQNNEPTERLRNLNTDLKELWIQNSENYYVKDKGDFEMVKAAVIAPILFDLLRQKRGRIDAVQEIVKELEFFSSEKEVYDIIKLLNLNIHDYLYMLNDINYIGKEFMDKYGINAFYLVY